MIVNIISSCLIIVRLNPKWKLPIGQPLYTNKIGKFTWRVSPMYVGTTISKQDCNGFVKVKIGS
jgi:hypothetical protein